MTAPIIQRTLVKADDTAHIKCPECNRAKTICVSKYRSSRHTLNVKCTCGHSFPVKLDFRRLYRKKTALPGIYLSCTSAVKGKNWETNITGFYSIKYPTKNDGYMQVTNLSAGGLQFVTSNDHLLQAGQQILVAFTLDDRKQSEITKKVTIQAVNDSVIGCRFLAGEPLEHALRFYLFP
jgi:hypothetical protein